VKRRTFFAAAGGALALAGCGRLQGFFDVPPERRPIAALFPGPIDDGGFLESAYRGLVRVREELKVPVRHLDRVPLEREALLGALRELGNSDAALVIAVGAETSDAVQRAAWEMPDQRFAVVQGTLLRPNLAAYVVEQPQSAWLAGAAAALLSKSGAIGHVGVARDAYSLSARAAFAAGARTANEKVRMLTTFALAADAVPSTLAAQAAQGADIVFAMPDAVRAGAIDAARPRGVRLIGAVGDWVATHPDVFVASAVADGGHAVFSAVRDLHDNVFVGDLVRRFGLRVPSAVRLSLVPGTPEAVRARIDDYRAQVAAGRIAVPETYTGPEFNPG
jgi:basic membrane protein A